MWFVLCGASCNHIRYIPQTIPQDTKIVHESKIPVSFEGSWAPVIDVEINGNGPYRFSLTSDAAISIIGSGLADELGLKPGSVEGTDIILSDGGFDSISYRQIDSLKIGSNEFSKFDCIRSTQPIYNTAEIVGLQGALGIHVFSNVLLVFNYKEQTLTIEAGYLSPDDEDVIPFTRNQFGDKMLLTGKLNGNEQKFILALDDPFSFYLDHKTEETVKYLEDLRPFAVKHSPTGLFKEYQGKLDGCIEIGNYRFENPTVQTSLKKLEIISEGTYYNAPVPRAIFPLVGGNLLKHFEVTIDQRSKLVRLRRLHENQIEL